MTEHEKLIEVAANALYIGDDDADRKYIANLMLDAIERAGYQVVRWERVTDISTSFVDEHSIMMSDGSYYRLAGLTPPKQEPA